MTFGPLKGTANAAIGTARPALQLDGDSRHMLIGPLGSAVPLSLAMTRSVSLHGRARFLVAIVAAGCAAPMQSPPISRPSTPASAVRDYGRIEGEVFAALNRARTDPQGMAASIEELIRHYDGRLFRRPSSPMAIQTNEGAAAAREAVSALRAQRPVGRLAPSPGLTRAARDHVDDQGRSGSTGHTGSDGSSVTDRVARYGAWEVSISENIDYSPVVHGGEIIENLLIDDGVSDRGHRRNIFEPSSTVVGIACGPHPRYAATCVIVQAGGFRPK
jgi:uncharacterized protein YkwD